MKYVVILIILLFIVFSALMYITGKLGSSASGELGSSASGELGSNASGPFGNAVSEPDVHAGDESEAACVTPAAPENAMASPEPRGLQSSGGAAAGNVADESLNTVPAAELEEKTKHGWKLEWNDEFSGSIVNDNYWTLQTGEDIWGNNELQYYTDRAKNCRIENGKLIINGLREKYGNSHYTSARIVTKDKLSFLYGRIEVRAKLPRGKGLLSAIWLLPCEYIYSDRTKNGEFDLVEMLGNDPKKIFGVVHYSFSGKKKSYKKYGTIDYSKSFHVYSIEWDPKKIKWLVDDKVFFTFNYSNKFDKDYKPFNKPFYLIINLAIGGDWPGSDLSKTTFPSPLEIDYVRYYLKRT